METKYVICVSLKPNALPIKRGTITAPAYIAKTCCNPKAAAFPLDNTITLPPLSQRLLCHPQMLQFEQVMQYQHHFLQQFDDPFGKTFQ